MRFGFHTFMVDPAELPEIARTADDCGWDSIQVARSNLAAIKNWLDSEYENLGTEFDPLNARKVSDILALNLARNMPSHILGE